MTGGLWPSALVAALFAIHPLHVESVAWVAERRDVLSGLFFMLTLAAYGEYVRHPQIAVALSRRGRIIRPGPHGQADAGDAATRCCCCSISGPSSGFAGRSRAPSCGPRGRRRFLGQSIVDKLPLFALAIAAAVVTKLTHNPVYCPLTLAERVGNAVVSCVAYLGQLFVPIGLSIFYSFPEAGRPAWQVAAAVVLLLAITAGGGDWPPIVSLFLRRLVLVRRHADSGARTDLFERGCPRRPLYVPFANRALHCAGLGGNAAGRFVAGSALAVWHRVGSGFGRLDGLHAGGKSVFGRIRKPCGSTHCSATEKPHGTLHSRSGLAPNERRGLRWRNIARPWK